MALLSGFVDSPWEALTFLRTGWGPGLGEVMKELEQGREGELCSWYIKLI